jgi:hypothetical protein
VSEKSTGVLLIPRESPGRHGSAKFFECNAALVIQDRSGAVQFRRIGPEEGDS